MKTAFGPTLITLLLAASSLSATTHYVSVASTKPTPPYTNWVTAATSIQLAVDAAVAGDEIVVANGTYGSATVNTPLLLRSVSGPQATLIEGGAYCCPCVYLTGGATLSGFTLAYGVTDTRLGPPGAGAYCESTSAVLTNCTLSTNFVSEGDGGGAYGGTLNNCTLTGNDAERDGGGAYNCILNNCTLTGNYAERGGGGGAYNCILNNCTLTDNRTLNGDGGGAYNCILNNCTLMNNSTRFSPSEGGWGGGACGGTLNNCMLSGNSSSSGGGACGGTLNNCMLRGNGGGFSGGGAWAAR